MITEKQLRIFEVFAKKPFAEHTRKEIKLLSKEKSNNLLSIMINSLKKEGVILEKIVGKSGLLTLNLDNDLTYHYLALCNNYRMNHLVSLCIKTLKDELNSITPFYSVVIFGSYALGNQKKESDLDIAVFVHKENRKINASVNSTKLKTPLDLDVQVISRKEMIELLTNDDENLGKQIARKHMAVHNHHIFYDIVKEGMKNGFRA